MLTKEAKYYENSQSICIFMYLITLFNLLFVLYQGRWFSPGTPVSSTNKTDRHDITEILLKAALRIM